MAREDRVYKLGKPVERSRCVKSNIKDVRSCNRFLSERVNIPIDKESAESAHRNEKRKDHDLYTDRFQSRF
jgi:hypothetical protein